jgi:capsular polysaccharide transport system permease protein
MADASKKDMEIPTKVVASDTAVAEIKPRASLKDKQPAVQKPTAPRIAVRPLASKATRKTRHWGLFYAFIIMVLLPIGATGWYLNVRAADQYASTVAFTVRSEDVSSPSDFLGGLAPALTGAGSGSDSDILYEFIRSQALVERIDEQLELRNFYSPPSDQDPVFAFDPDGTIEDLTTYWQRMVRISYDASSGLMELRVLAFNPTNAQTIANSIFDQSTAMINDLSASAREDATRYAREDLDRAVERLKKSRESLTAFRISSEIVDPAADIQGQMGLLNLLQSQQVEALIEFDLLNNSTREGDPRLEQARRRIEVIEARIREERQKFGVGGGDNNTSYAETIAEFERLAVDREFAEQSYAAARVGFDSARTQANRQSLYLAAYITPTLAERSQFPNKPFLVAIVGLFAFLIWAIMALSYYALRDRR